LRARKFELSSTEIYCSIVAAAASQPDTKPMMKHTHVCESVALAIVEASILATNCIPFQWRNNNKRRWKNMTPCHIVKWSADDDDDDIIVGIKGKAIACVCCVFITIIIITISSRVEIDG